MAVKVVSKEKFLSNWIKLLFSSLFARRMSYLIVDPECPNSWLASNISPDEVFLRTTNMQHCVHKITFVDPTIREAIEEQFPVMKERMFIDSTLVQSTLNKTKHPLEYKMHMDEHGKIFLKDMSETPDLIEGTDKAPDIFIGSLLPPDARDVYFRLYNEFINAKQWDEGVQQVTWNFPVERLDRSKVVFTTVFSKNADSLEELTHRVRIPLRAGLNCVSPDYTSKCKATNQKLEALVTHDTKGAMRVAMRYQDDFVRVVSAQVHVTWYPMRPI